MIPAENPKPEDTRNECSFASHNTSPMKAYSKPLPSKHATTAGTLLCSLNLARPKARGAKITTPDKRNVMMFITTVITIPTIHGSSLQDDTTIESKFANSKTTSKKAICIALEVSRIIKILMIKRFVSKYYRIRITKSNATNPEPGFTRTFEESFGVTSNIQTIVTQCDINSYIKFNVD
jgi:hypothetical protein